MNYMGTGLSAALSCSKFVAAPPAVRTSDPAKKYRLASGLSETTPISAIGEKLMDTPVSLTLREVLASSSDIATYMHDQTRERRMPIDWQLESMILTKTPA